MNTTKATMNRTAAILRIDHELDIVNKRMARRQRALNINAVQIAWYTAAKYHVGEALLLAGGVSWILTRLS
jgi:hypothetical protein